MKRALPGILFLLFVAGCGQKPPVVPKDRWLYLSLNLLPERNVAQAEEVLKRASAAGYTTVALSDFKFNILGRMPPEYFANVERIKSLATKLKLEIIPCIFPVGHSGGIVANDPNLVEAMPVIDAPFLVNRSAANLDWKGAILENGGFEQSTDSNSATGWTIQDSPGDITSIDTRVRHSGVASLKIYNPGGHNGRLGQKIVLTPHQLYRVSFWAKTEGFHPANSIRLVVRPEGGGRRNLSYLNVEVRETQDWKLHEVVFNSQEVDAAELFIGSWEGQKGLLWIDDVAIEKIGMVNLVRREGCPLIVKSETGEQYVEGKDFLPVHDEILDSAIKNGEIDVYHKPPPILLAPKSRIRDGQKLKVSFYHAALTHDHQPTCCLTDPKLYEVLADQMQRIEKLFHPRSVFMQHDEIRVANWCGLCQATHKTPGELLAENVRKCIDIVHKTSPNANIWVWSDMFDPNHNARDGFYLANGTFAESWKDLPPDIGIVNWNFKERSHSLPWFSDRGHAQILAGYYDDSVADINTWLRSANGVKGVQGVMYTTWMHDYSRIEDFARTAWDRTK